VQSALEPGYGGFPNQGFEFLYLQHLAEKKPTGDVALIMSLDRTGKYLKKGQQLLQQDKTGAAMKAFQQAVSCNSRFLEGWLQLGQLYMRLDKFAEAVDCFRRITEIDRDHLLAYGNLGICYYRLQRMDDAVSSYRRVLDLQADNVIALCNIAMVLLDKGEREEAATLCDRAICIQPGFAGAYLLRGSIHSALGAFELAAESYHKALKLGANVLTAIAGEANALIKLGRIEQANALISPHVQTTIGNVSLAIAYASTHEVHGDSDRAAGQLEKLLASSSLAHTERLQLHFSAGALYDSMKMYDRAFGHYRMGNNYVARHYSRETDKSRLDRTRAAFSADTLERLANTEQSGPIPVFIVGVPRSGTSLVEKILSRHSQVCAGGEMPYIPDISVSLCDSAGSRITYPENILDADVANIRQHAKQHQLRLESIANGLPVVTDKLPHNFLYLGLIQILYPGARIIHCRRNVLDTCLSNYFQYFSGSLDYAYNLEDIAHHYNHYSDLMAHWRQVLNLDMLEVDYEALVMRQEETTRELIDFCGLQWEADCLSFHESSAVTRTASYAQVRQPMYGHAVERWRNYEKHLQPLVRRLTPSLLDKP
jgi:tetratricopeptide (TPR) repeat protein